MRRLTLQVLDFNDKIVFSRESISGCNNCLEQQAVGFGRMLKAYFNDSFNGFKTVAGSGSASPHTVVAFFSDAPTVQHYEDLEIDCLPEYVTQENVEKCLLKNIKTYKGD